jgi:hypothetical protein
MKRVILVHRWSLKYFALAGDCVYVLWILYNGIDEGFRNILSVQALAAIGLVVLLMLNTFLLSPGRK